VAQLVEHLLCKLKALNSTTSPTKKKKKVFSETSSLSVKNDFKTCAFSQEKWRNKKKELNIKRRVHCGQQKVTKLLAERLIK
jgi:hypothetical protein